MNIDKWIEEQLEIVERATKGDDIECRGAVLSFYSNASTTVPRALRMIKVLREALEDLKGQAWADLNAFPPTRSKPEDVYKLFLETVEQEADKALAYTGEES